METIVGKKMMHHQLGKVLVVSQKKKSRTMFNVKQIDRGLGWDSEMKRYVGYTLETESGKGWCLGDNKDYGKIVEVHKKELKVIPKKKE